VRANGRVATDASCCGPEGSSEPKPGLEHPHRHTCGSDIRARVCRPVGLCSGQRPACPNGERPRWPSEKSDRAAALCRRWLGRETHHSDVWLGRETGHNDVWLAQETGHNDACLGQETGHNDVATTVLDRASYSSLRCSVAGIRRRCGQVICIRYARGGGRPVPLRHKRLRRKMLDQSSAARGRTTNRCLAPWNRTIVPPGALM
jgi:hypothetical protein